MKKGIRFFQLFMAMMLGLGAMMGPFMLSASASGTASFAVGFQRYDIDTNQYVKADSAQPGDTVKLVVKNQKPIAGFGGIQFRLTYDSRYFICQSYSGKFGVSGNGLASDFTVKENGESSVVNASLDTVSSGYSLPTGDLFEITFVVKTIAEGSSVSTKANMSVQTLYDYNGADIVADTIEPATISVGTLIIPPEVIALFEAITEDKIFFNQETLNAIVAAETAVSNFNRAEFNAFKKQYPEHYNNYLQARNRYNQLAADAPYEQIMAEIEAFKSEFSDVIEMTVDAVEIRHEARIKEANIYFNSMSEQARAFIDAQTKEKVPALLARVKALIKAEKEENDAKMAADAFILTYTSTQYNLWSVSERTLEASYGEINEILHLAMMDYDSLEDNVKTLLGNQKNIMDNMKKQIDLYLKNDVHEAAIQDQITSFQTRWRKLLTITASTVKVNDETALQMMLTDAEDADNKKPYPDEVRARLNKYITGAKNLLNTIAQMKQEKPPADPDNDDQVAKDPEIDSTTDSSIVPTPPTAGTDSDIQMVIQKETLDHQIPPIILILGCICLGLIVVGIYPAILYLKLMKSGALSKK